MGLLSLDSSGINGYVFQSEIKDYINCKTDVLRKINNISAENSDAMGWFYVTSYADQNILDRICSKASEVRENADIFLIIGVGGSNQGARAAIEALGNINAGSGKNPLILYAGNNLSPRYLNNILRQLKDKSVYIDIIAKNFATLEPGIAFRVIRGFIEDTYGTEEASKRIITTASPDNSGLERLSSEKGYYMLPFPLDVGGRFSVLTPVGLLPMAVARLDIYKMLEGAVHMEKLLKSEYLETNPAILYAVIRNLLLNKGYSIEILAYFEPLLHYFSKWWIQLFGESEGKDGKGIFPCACSFTEDLHSMGQYIQQGRRALFETFINLENQGDSLFIRKEKHDIDNFGYLDDMDFAYLNDTAYKAALKAHSEGGVPCMTISVPELDEYYFGQLFYFFEYACYVSGTLSGVNPFDQPGVENYKENIFKALREKKS